MEPNGSSVGNEQEQDLDDLSNSTTATTPSSLGDVVAHDDLPNSDGTIAGAGQIMSDISPTEYADSIKSLNARLRQSKTETQDAR